MNTKKLTIFADVGTNPEIQNLVSYLKKNGDTLAFRQTFALQYGIPLWRNASVFGQGANTTMLVPLRDYDSNILSGIWVFEIKGSTIKYNVAINDICKPYYQQLKPFFKQIEQDIFGIYTKNTSYSLSKNTLKGRIGAGVNHHCVITCTGGGDYLNCRDYCWSTVDIGGDSGGDGAGGAGGDYTNPTPPPSGGATPPADPKPDPETTPCMKIQTVSGMRGLPDKLSQLLRDARNLNHETGYTISNRYNYTHFNGSVGDCQVPFGVNEYTVAIIHSHPSMCGNMFSPGDIKVIWDLCQSNTIDKEYFQLGVVTSTGNTYFLSVDDYKKFKVFADNWHMSNGDISGLNRFFETNYYDNRWSSSQLESKFLDFIKDTGLTVLKGDANNRDFKALQKDASGNVTNLPCNK